MVKIKDMDYKKLYQRINKRWIGEVYGWSLFILFFCLGVVVGYNQIEPLYLFSNYAVVFSAIIVYPITFIRYKHSIDKRKERIESEKEKEDNNES